MASGAQRRPYYTYMGPGRQVYYLLGERENILWEKKQSGDGKASYELGMYFLSLKWPNIDEGYYCFSDGAGAGAGAGDANCMIVLAEMHLIGYGAYLDRDIAKNFYRRALEKGEAFDARCTGALAVLQKAFPEVKAK